MATYSHPSTKTNSYKLLVTTVVAMRLLKFTKRFATASAVVTWLQKLTLSTTSLIGCKLVTVICGRKLPVADGRFSTSAGSGSVLLLVTL